MTLEEICADNVYVSIFQTLCNSHIDFTNDARENYNHLKQSIQLLLGKDLFRSEMINDEKEIINDLSKQTPQSFSTSDSSVSEMKMLYETPQSPKQPDIVKSLATLYVAPKCLNVHSMPQRNHTYPPYINESEFVEVPEHEHVFSPERLVKKEMKRNAPDLFQSKPRGPVLEFDQAQNNDIASLKVKVTSSSSFFQPPPLLLSSCLSQDVSETTDSQDNSVFQNSFSSLPSWVLEKLQSPFPPSPQVLAILTAYCWAGYYHTMEETSRKSKLTWLERLRQHSGSK